MLSLLTILPMTDKTKLSSPGGSFLPHREEQHHLIALHSPASIEGAFVFMLREHFKKMPDHLWKWDKNPTDSRVAIDVGDESLVTHADKTPSIWVAHGQTVYGNIVMGNKGIEHFSYLQKEKQHHYSTADADMSITCCSPKRGESLLIADIIQKFIHFSNRILCTAFKFRDISPVVLNSTRNFERDKTIYITPISFRISFELTWMTMPAASPLNALAMRLESKDEEVLKTLNLTLESE